MLLLLAATCATAHPLEEHLGQTWVLTDGWPPHEMTLRPVDKREQDDWIGLVFQADGTITWKALRAVDPEEGCSNGFGGFRGTWTARAGQVSVQLEERTRMGETYPASLVLEHPEPDRIVLTQPRARAPRAPSSDR